MRYECIIKWLVHELLLVLFSKDSRVSYAGVHAYCDACTTCLLAPIFRRCMCAIRIPVSLRYFVIAIKYYNFMQIFRDISFAISKYKYYFNATSIYTHIASSIFLSLAESSLHKILNSFFSTSVPQNQLSNIAD